MPDFNTYPALTNPAADDTLLALDVSATPPAAGTVKQLTVGTALALVGGADLGGGIGATVTGIGGRALSTGQAYQVLAASHSAHMLTWFATLAIADAASTIIACVGDSFTSGNLAGLKWEQTWPVLLQKRLNARYPSAVATGHGRGLLPPLYPGATLALDYVTVTGTPEVDYGHGFNGAAYNIASPSPSSFAYALNGDNAVILYYQQPSGGSFQYTVDGGSATTVSTAAGTPGTGAELVSLGAAGAHTLNISYVASTGNCLIMGAAEFNGDVAAGLQVWNCGMSGSKASDWAGYDFFEFGPAATGLMIIELGGNDLIAGDTSAQFATSLAAVIAAARAGVSSSLSILLLAVPDNTTGWGAYLDVMYATAAGDSLCDVLDMGPRMPLANTFIFDASSGELTAAGHVMVASAVAAFLDPQ